MRRALCMRRALQALVCAALCLTMSGCGSGGGDPESGNIGPPPPPIAPFIGRMTWGRTPWGFGSWSSN